MHDLEVMWICWLWNVEDIMSLGAMRCFGFCCGKILETAPRWHCDYEVEALETLPEAPLRRAQSHLKGELGRPLFPASSKNMAHQ